MDEHLMLASLFEGYYPAHLLIDDPANPQTAFMWMHHRGYLAGNVANRAFVRTLSELFAAAFNPQQTTPFRFYYPPEWEETLTGYVLHNHTPIRLTRQYYTTPASANEWRTALPEGIEILPVDAALLPDCDLENQRELLAEVQSMNPSVRAFLKQRFGVYARYDDTIAGWCLSEHNSEGRCDIGIATVEAFQRRGIGLAMTRAFIDLAYQKSVQLVGWDCWSDNTASVATVRRAGFVQRLDYPVLIVQ